jgi:phosphohistidine phosphatase
VPDLVLSSTAVRARSTAELVAEAAGFDGETVELDALYLAPPSKIAAVVVEHAGEAGRVLVVAHNPGIESFVEAASGRSEAMPTAALAHFRLPIDDWQDFVLDRSAELRDLWRPRELE